jgi:hypothetical protein
MAPYECPRPCRHSRVLHTGLLASSVSTQYSEYKLYCTSTGVGGLQDTARSGHMSLRDTFVMAYGVAQERGVAVIQYKYYSIFFHWKKTLR